MGLRQNWQLHNSTVPKTYPVKALWPLLPFEVAPAPLQATLDACGGGLVKYASSKKVSGSYLALFSLAQPLSAIKSENLTGFHPAADLVPKQSDDVVGYFYALLGGTPLCGCSVTCGQSCGGCPAHPVASPLRGFGTAPVWASAPKGIS